MNEKPIVEINDNQLRRIGVSLGLLDQGLCEIRQWAEGHEYQSVLYHERNDLAPHQKMKILMVIGEIQGLIVDLRDLLNLDERIIEASRTIRAQCSMLWEQVSELQSRHLKGYGKVSPSLAESLDPKIKKIMESLINLSDTITYK
jgi:hypothetical protein